MSPEPQSNDAPTCGKCGGVMTPENAWMRPELFLHDDCLPSEARVHADSIMSRDKERDALRAELEQAKRDLSASDRAWYGKLQAADATLADMTRQRDEAERLDTRHVAEILELTAQLDAALAQADALRQREASLEARLASIVVLLSNYALRPGNSYIEQAIAIAKADQLRAQPAPAAPAP